MRWKKFTRTTVLMTFICASFLIYRFVPKTHQKTSRETSSELSVYFSCFEEEYPKFEKDFKVYSYNTNHFAPVLNNIYDEVVKIEKEDPSFPLRWQISRKKQNLLDVNSVGQYALEFWFPSWLSASRFSTRNSEEATAFFIDIKCTALKNTQQKRLPGQRVTQLYIKKMLTNLSSKQSSNVKKMNFVDHFYVCSHDMGIECIRNAPVSFRTNAIGIVHTADFIGSDAESQPWNKYEDVKPKSQSGLIFNAHRDLTAPPFVKVDVRDSLAHRKSFNARKYLAMFLGSSRARPVRQKIFSLFQNNSNFLIGKAYGDEYEKAFQDSKFCLVVRGLVTSTVRFSEVFLYSCIPVIISDGYVPPFSSTVNWRSFSIFVQEDDLVRLPKILGSIDEGEWSMMQKNLMKVRNHFLYNNPPISGDAFHMILFELWKKFHKFKAFRTLS